MEVETEQIGPSRDRRGRVGRGGDAADLHEHETPTVRPRGQDADAMEPNRSALRRGTEGGHHDDFPSLLFHEVFSQIPGTTDIHLYVRIADGEFLSPAIEPEDQSHFVSSSELRGFSPFGARHRLQR